MKPKTLILMATAIVCGLGASYMTSRLLAERGSGETEVAKVRILVAKKHLDMATPLKNPGDFFEFKEFVAGDEPKNGVTDPAQVKGKFLKRALRKSDALTTEDVSDNFTSLPVPPGMRAVGLRVNTESIAGGFASLPGSRVDIINTVKRQNDDESKSSYLLEQVLVLAADAQSGRGEGGAMPASVVTVALSPEDTLRVTLAKDLGPLTLVLRDSGDVSKAAKGSVTVNEVLHNNRAGGARAEGVAGATPEEGATGGGSELSLPLLGKIAIGRKQPLAKAPAKASTPAQVAKAATPNEPPPIEKAVKVRKHVVVVVEGQHTRKVLFVLNDKGEVNQEEVRETPPALSPTPPPPAAGARPVPPVAYPAAAPKRNPGPRAAQAGAL